MFLAVSMMAALAAGDPGALPSSQDLPAEAVQAAQEPPLGGEVSRLEDVVAQGGTLRSLADRFVGEVAATTHKRGLARWNGRVCVGVINLRNDLAQFIADRISTVAMGEGLGIGEPGCRPNVIVAFTNDAQAVADGMVTQNRGSLRLNSSGMDQGRTALETFRTSDQAVRWWQVSLPIVADTGQRAYRIPGDSQPLLVQAGGRATRGRHIADSLQRVVIVVDVDQLEGVGWAPLADYLSMVSMAQVDPEGDTRGFDTVLNLFETPEAVDGLTEWDAAYLRGLYRAPRERVSPSSQSWWMARVTRQARAAEEAAADED